MGNKHVKEIDAPCSPDPIQVTPEPLVTSPAADSPQDDAAPHPPLKADDKIHVESNPKLDETRNLGATKAQVCKQQSMYTVLAFLANLHFRPSDGHFRPGHSSSECLQPAVKMQRRGKLNDAGKAEPTAKTSKSTTENGQVLKQAESEQGPSVKSTKVSKKRQPASRLNCPASDPIEASFDPPGASQEQQPTHQKSRGTKDVEPTPAATYSKEAPQGVKRGTAATGRPGTVLQCLFMVSFSCYTSRECTQVTCGAMSFML